MQRASQVRQRFFGYSSPAPRKARHGGSILEPGQMASAALNFSKASGGRIRYTVRVLAGVGTR
jgi:hypothetical protein